MKKNMKLVIFLIGLFLFSSKVMAASVPADGQWHEISLGSGQLKSCSSTDSRVEVKYSNGKCQIKNNASTSSNFDVEVSYTSALMGSVNNTTTKVSFYNANSNNSSENIKAVSETYKTDGKWHNISGEVSGKVIGCTKESGNIEVVFTNGECRVRSTSSSNETGRVKITTNVASSVLNSTVSVNFANSSSSNSEEDKYQKQAEDNWEGTFDKTCSNSRVLGAFKIVGMGITIVKIIVPIIIILYGMWDLFNIVTSGKDDAIKENAMKFLRRLIIGALVFFVPTILLSLFDFVGSAWSDVKQKYDNCVKCMLDTSKCPNIDLTKTEG